MKNKILIAIGVIVIVLAVWLVARDQKTTNPSSSPATTTTATTVRAGESLYTDPSGRFTLAYPQGLSITGPKSFLTTSWRANTTSLGYLLATLSVPKSSMPGTNFADATLTVGQSTDKAELGGSGCPANLAGYVPGSAAAVVINGQTYTKITTSNAGAGNFYQTTGYYTIRGSDCYAIEYTIHSTNIANYDPSQGIKEFDKTSITNLLEGVVQSVSFTGKNN